MQLPDNVGNSLAGGSKDILYSSEFEGIGKLYSKCLWTRHFREIARCQGLAYLGGSGESLKSASWNSPLVAPLRATGGASPSPSLLDTSEGCRFPTRLTLISTSGDSAHWRYQPLEQRSHALGEPVRRCLHLPAGFSNRKRKSCRPRGAVCP